MEILPEWEAAARRFLEVGGAAMVLGAPDTGKSTLSRYLVYRAYAAGRPDWDRENLALLTPLASEAAARVRFVKLGKLRLNLEGQELPHV